MDRKIWQVAVEIMHLKDEVEKMQFEAQLIALAEEEHADDTQAEVLEQEADYINGLTDGTELDEAYAKHKEAMQSLDDAQETLRYITKALEMLDRAEYYLSWAE